MVLTKLLHRLKKNALLAGECKALISAKSKRLWMSPEIYESPRDIQASSIADLANQISNVDLAYLISARADHIQIDIGDRVIRNKIYTLKTEITSFSFDGVDLVLGCSTSDYCDIYESPEFSDLISDLPKADVVNIRTKNHTK